MMAITTWLRSIIDRWFPSKDSGNINMTVLPNQHTPVSSNQAQKPYHPSITSTTNISLSPTPLTQAQKDYMAEHPLKYIGYPLFTKFLASSQDLVILRRFDELHARVLLDMQDDIVQKEEKITWIDQELSQIDTPQDIEHINGSFREDAKTGLPAQYLPDRLADRCRLLKELRKEIRHYDQMILNYRQLRSDPEATKHHVQNVKQYLENRGHSTLPGEENKGPLLQQEAQYIYRDGDLLQLVPDNKAPLRRWIERWTWFMLGWWFKKYPKGSRKYTDFVFEDEVAYQSNGRIDGFITTLSLLMGLFLLIGPLEILNRIDNSSVADKTSTKLHVICGLITLFLGMLGAIMPAKPWETLGATAAYAAVLMVFMQINTSSSSS